jgi:hypothetical protein
VSHYIHHVPGRLRIRVPELKRNPVGAARVAVALAGQAGVLRHEVKARTGSILVIYDRPAVCAEAVVESLRGAGVVAPEATWEEGPRPADVRGTAGKAGRALVGMAAEKALERSAAALFAAIL